MILLLNYNKMSTQISEQDLLQFTHQLHCKLRKKVTGLSALNEIENIMLFRFIEERKDIKLKDNITFSKICEKYATDDKIKEDKKEPTFNKRNCYKLWEAVYDISNDNCMILEYHNNDIIKKYIKSSVHKISIFTDKEKATLSQLIQELFNMVYNKFKNIKFDSSFYDMFGSAHEAFKTNAHKNSGKHTGQHFTPMDIKRLVAEELKVKSTDIYYEPCAGTGGFVHTIDKYVRENEGEKESKKFKKNIYANEYNAEIIKPLMINMLLHDIPVDNIHERDSLSNENCELMKGLADVIGTNYPFGMSNSIELSDYIDKKYWGCLIRNKNVIKNSTGQFIIHIYRSLKEKGRAGFVSDRGILNNGDDSSWENDVRKFMIKNTNLYKIWLLPNGVFPYTNFATCVIFFRKGEKTKKVEIFEGKFKDAKNKIGLYIEEKPVKTFTLKELEENGYSLKMEEKKEEIKKGRVKLGDVVNILSGKFNSNDMDNNGNIPFYSCVSDNPCGMHSKYSYEYSKDYIIFIGSGGSQNSICNDTIGMGKCYIQNGKVALRSGTHLFELSDNKFNIKYLYYYFWITRYIINSKAKFSGNLGVLSKEILNNILIPSLSLKHQQEIVDFLDIQFKLYDINLLAKQIKDIPLFNLLIDKKYDLFADALHLIYRKMELDALHTKMDKDKKAVFNIRVNGLDCKEYKLGDIVEIEFGTRITKGKDSVDENEKIKFPVYGGGDITFYTKQKNRSGKNILISRFGVSPKCVRIINGDIFINDSCMSVKIINNKKSLFNYVAYYLLYNQENIFKCAEGQGQKNMITNDLLKKFIINIPSLQEQEKIIKEIEQIESTQSTYAEYGKMIQSQIESINKVIENLTKLNKENEKESDNTDNSSESEDEKPIKKVKQTKKQESSESESESDVSSSESEKEYAKPKKIIKSKQIKKIESSSEESDNSSESEIEEAKPKKIIKSKQTKKIESSSESESNDSLASSSESEIKAKKNIKKNK